MKQGDRVICNGYEGTVMKVCTGQLAGMVEVRVPGGLTCVDAKEIKPLGATCTPEIVEFIDPTGALRQAGLLTVKAAP